jgi:tetratricopeptide (TPR) repeat protein
LHGEKPGEPGAAPVEVRNDGRVRNRADGLVDRIASGERRGQGMTIGNRSRGPIGEGDRLVIGSRRPFEDQNRSASNRFGVQDWRGGEFAWNRDGDSRFRDGGGRNWSGAGDRGGSNAWNGGRNWDRSGDWGRNGDWSRSGDWNNGRNWNRSGRWNDDWNGNWNGSKSCRNVWVNNFVHVNYRAWYNGCWNGGWGGWYGWGGWGFWRSPFWFGLNVNANPFGWGLYGYGNPYLAAAYYSPAYACYSTPIATVAYETTSAYPAAASVAPAAAVVDDGLAEFDRARRDFQSAQYASALEWTEKALAYRPKDPVVHEFRALCLFALGDYQRAAMVLNSLLATSPGWDWATMSSFYASSKVYERQLRALEAHRNANPEDAAARFVLAYHYLVCDFPDAAAKELRKIVALQPGDQVAARILESLDSSETPIPPAPPEVQAPPPEAPAQQPQGGQEAADAQSPQTDLVGKWRAKRADGAVFDVQIGENGEFQWAVVAADGKETKLAGRSSVSDNLLILESESQGAMIGRVESLGPDKFSFTLLGAPPSDPGLTFERQK